MTRNVAGHNNHPEHPESPHVIYVERRREFNGATVVALVCSILWLFGLGSLLGVIIGISSARQCKRDNLSGEGIGHVAWALGLLGLLSAFGFFSAGGFAAL